MTVYVLVDRDSAELEVRMKEFDTHSGALNRLRAWLAFQRVAHVTMESTGVSRFDTVRFGPRRDYFEVR